MAEDTCPACGTLVTRHSTLDDNKPCAPKPGDLSVCIRCTAFLTFDERLALRLLTTDEFNALDLDTRVMLQRMRKAAWEVIPLSMRVPRGK